MRKMPIPKDLMYHKFRLYGFLKNLRFFDPFLILFFRETGLSFLEIGVLFSVRELSINLLEIPTGIIADAYGRRRAMLASFSFYLASLALFYLFSGIGVYMLAMVLFAFGETLRSGTHKAMILEYLKIKGILELKVDYYGHTRAASQLGSALAALIAAALVFYTGSYRVIFLATMIPYVMELVLMASYPRELDAYLPRMEGGLARRFIRRFGSAGRNSLKQLGHPPLLKGLFSGAGFDALFKSTKDYLQPILESQALALPVFLSFQDNQRVAVVVGILYFLIYLATSYASSHASSVQGKFTSLPAAVNVTLFAGIAILLIVGLSSWGNVYWVALAAFLGFYVLQNVRRPMMVGYLSGLIPHHTMAAGLSAETQLRTLIMAGIAPLIGFLADQLGVGAALTVIALIAGVALPLLRVHSS